MDQQPESTIPGALEILAIQVQQAINTAAWSISECAEGGPSLRPVRSVDSVFQAGSGLTVLTDLGPTSYEMDEFPASARAIDEGTFFVAGLRLEGSDPAEVALLSRLGYQAVLGIGVPAGQTCYLLEFYSHIGHEGLAEIAPLITVLAAYCVSKLSGNRSSPRRP